MTTPVQQAKEALGGPPSEDDIRAWCAACDADDQVPDLIATVRHVASMYHEYRRQMQAGMKHLQESSVPLCEATSLFRIYDTTVVPGLFTTAEYAAELFGSGRASWA